MDRFVALTCTKIVHLLVCWMHRGKNFRETLWSPHPGIRNSFLLKGKTIFLMDNF
jgi:hypothetical protein